MHTVGSFKLFAQAFPSPWNPHLTSFLMVKSYIFFKPNLSFYIFQETFFKLLDWAVYLALCFCGPLYISHPCFNMLLKLSVWGLPWWRSGWESACQCRGHGFKPWSGKIPHAAEQLSPWATTTEPARLEPLLCNKRGRDEARAPRWRVAPARRK